MPCFAASDCAIAFVTAKLVLVDPGKELPLQLHPSAAAPSCTGGTWYLYQTLSVTRCRYCSSIISSWKREESGWRSYFGCPLLEAKPS